MRYTDMDIFNIDEEWKPIRDKEKNEFFTDEVSGSDHNYEHDKLKNRNNDVMSIIYKYCCCTKLILSDLVIVVNTLWLLLHIITIMSVRYLVWLCL